MLTILRRELNSYFTSAIGYIYLAVFYFFSGYFFQSVISINSTDLSSVFLSLFLVLMFIVPILTMRLMSEDMKLRTDQLLLTAPLSLSGLVYGKFLAALTLFAAGTGITLIYAVVLSAFQVMEWTVIVGNILGLLLLGAALISIGLFISSLTENQVIAAVGGFAVMLMLMIMDAIAGSVPVAFLSELLYKISFMTRYAPFTTGILNLSNVLYFLSVAVIFNFLTVRVLEKKRWS
ncbi:MAG TPA: ABC transporter [Firmicutes bacterium]|nr:ABC transporter [Bacillota bacterium]